MKRFLVLLAVFVVVLSTGTLAFAAPSGVSGFRALTGAEARAFHLPGDTRIVWEATDPATGLTQTRFQQYVGRAEVFGGQLTTLRRGSEQVAVIGAYYPGLAPKNQVRLSAENARTAAAREVGAADEHFTRLAIDPQTGNQFYIVEARSFASRWFVWIDAASGRTLNKYSAIETGSGIGVKGDTKTIDTTLSGSSYVMVAADGRQRTYDAKGAQTSRKLPGTLFTDSDDLWDLAGRTSPAHPAAVDAHYYAGVTDDFYLGTYGRNSLDNAGMTMVSSVHYGNKYNNAFWNGSQMVYGDGDGTSTFRELSGGLDVVAHELTHGVTEFTSNLVYQNESGALNEAFSDMMGNSAEFYAQTNTLDPTVQPDWYIGEDVYLGSTTVPGFRNMSDPREDGDPDHYSERYTGTSDNGGVHTNSGIPNHAYFLLINGGKNAGCDTTGSGGHTHSADCDVSVAGLGLAKAEQIFYKGFTSLPSSATMGNARASTEAVAVATYGSGSPEHLSTSAAWQAVGVAAGATPPPSCDVAVTSVPFESAHPYSNNMNCTWTYTNATSNFRFHFSLLDVERNYDYIDIIDGNGNVLATLTGAYRSGYTSPVITTSVGKVRLRTDASVTKQGFKVDQILAP